ncbi:MAG: ATP-binding cassette domain-containing protein, partial [Methyloligellaceae bacterium]
IGTLLVMFNQLSAGALIAVMALVWRILSPLQAAFLSLNHVSQVIDSIKQVNHLMRITPERQTGQLPSFYRNFNGKLSFSGVGFRYNARSEPALRGINLEIKASEVIAITGASGVGKSTLLNIVTRLYQPQAGSVLLDDLDIRQIDIGELRSAIGYTSQKPQFFYGTIAQNLKLAHPTATKAEMEKIFRELGAWETIQQLEDGLDTRLQGSHTARFPNGFFQQLILARAFIKEAPIYLLDEPGSNLDRSGDEALMEKLTSLKGKSTVIMITHRPSHMRLADRVVVMNQGMIAADGPPDQILASLLGTGQKSQALAKS